MAQLTKSWQRSAAFRTRCELVSRFPKAFCDKRTPKKPLKIGILFDLIERCPDMKTWALKLALLDYCTGPSYLAAVLRGGARIDLEGNECAEITDAHIAHANKLLSEFPAELQRRWRPTADLMSVA